MYNGGNSVGTSCGESSNKKCCTYTIHKKSPTYTHGYPHIWKHMQLSENTTNTLLELNTSHTSFDKPSKEIPMHWQLLKNNRCPKCRKDFIKGLETTKGGYIDDIEKGNMSGTMFHHPCGLMITEQRYKEIISDQVINNLNNLSQAYE